MIFLAPVTRRDRPCCPFPTELEIDPGISDRWPNVKQPHFSENHDKSQVRKVCRLKARWLDATWPEDIARQSRTNTYRLNYNSKPFLSTFFIKFFSSSAHFGKKSSPFFFSDGKLQP